MRVRDLTGNFSFWSPISFDADVDGNKRWVLAAEVGNWFNARHGEVPITADDLDSMYRNFTTGLYPPKPQQLPVDYEHLSTKQDRKPGDGIAAAWILDLEKRNDGKELWAYVEYTDAAKEKVAKKEYKGFSPMFHPNWVTHGKKELGPTLLGGALTNYQTIPNCVLNCSLDPTTAVRNLADVADLPYSERERRVREAVEARFPPAYKDGGIDPQTYMYVRDVFEDRVIFQRGSSMYGMNYSVNDDLAVSFEGEPYEVTVDYPPVTSLSSEVSMKLKLADGKEVDVPAASLAALTLDALGEIPAIAELRKKIPAEGSRVVPENDFSALQTQVTTLSQTVETLKTENVTLKTANDQAAAKMLDTEIDALLREGRLLPAEKESFKKLALANRPLFDEMVTARKAAEPLVKLDGASNVVTGSFGAGGTGQKGSAVQQFDALVDELRSKDSKLSWADAILKAADMKPDLARMRNLELSVPIGNGGVVMAASV